MKHTQSSPRVSLTKILEEYETNIFEDDDEMHKLKTIISGLPELDKSLLILYADCGSMRKAAKVLGVSDFTIWNNIQRIKKIIKEQCQST